MNKTLKIALPFFALGVFCPMVVGIFTKLGEKETQEKRIANLPNFHLTDIEGQPFDQSDLLPHSEKIFIYFNSTCEYCQDEAKQFEQHLEKFKNIQLLFVSTEQPKTIKTFAQTYKLTGHDNIRFLYDPRADFTTLFGANSIPYILIYDANNKLLYKHKGAIKVENLLKEFRP